MNNNEYSIEKPKRSFVRIISLAVSLILVVVLVGVIYFFTKINRGSSDESVPVAVTIQPGESTRQIANNLAELKVIRNPKLFVLYTMYTNASSKIQAGDYALDRKMSIVEIVDLLTAGKVTRNEKKVTVIEGWNNKQLIDNLSKRNVATAEQLEAALEQNYEFKFGDVAKPLMYEGFIFPDTYSISKNSDAEALVKEALKNFESKITEEMLQDISTSGRTFKEVITLASIIEKEVGRNKSTPLTADDLTTMQEERELVASVFLNRLEAGMALQSDATVNYVTGKSDRRALFEDLEVDSRYNTYKYAGLPPGPISNPGIGSIKAAIYPAQSDYLYFLNSKEGIAYFGRTLQEHNSNREKYLD